MAWELVRHQLPSGNIQYMQSRIAHIGVNRIHKDASGILQGGDGEGVAVEKGEVEGPGGGEGVERVAGRDMDEEGVGDVGEGLDAGGGVEALVRGRGAYAQRAVVDVAPGNGRELREWRVVATVVLLEQRLARGDLVKRAAHLRDRVKRRWREVRQYLVPHLWRERWTPP